MENAIVRKLEAFGSMLGDDKDLLTSYTKDKRALEARRDLVKEGEPSQDVHVILAGIACRYKSFPDGRRQIVGLLIPGDMCDLNGFVLRTMDHSIGAITKIDYVLLKPGTIQTFLERPKLARALLMSAIADEGVLRAWIANIGQQSAYNRIAHFLCEMHYRFSAVGLGQNFSFNVGMNQTELGDCLGLTAVHINRSLVQLRQAGLIDYKRNGAMKILDIDKLMAAGAFQPNYLHYHETKASEYAF